MTCSCFWLTSGSATCLRTRLPSNINSVGALTPEYFVAANADTTSRMPQQLPCWNLLSTSKLRQVWSSAGADRHPELLADLFTCLSYIFKHLTKHVAPQLTTVLHDSRGLTYHTAPHVRQLAANAVGYLFRHTGQSGLKAGVQTVLHEAVVHPTPGQYPPPCASAISGCSIPVLYAAVQCSCGLQCKP